MNMNSRFAGLAAMLFLLLISSITTVSAQISAGGLPPSFQRSFAPDLGFPRLVVEMIPAIDINHIKREDEALPGTVRFAAPVKVHFDLENAGQWVQLNNGDRLWQLQLKASGALGLFVIYDHFYLPPGAQLFMYSPDHRQLLGAYTERNNKASGKFVTGMIKGEEAILEYFEPQEVAGQGIIQINRIFQAYHSENMKSSDSPFQVYSGFGDALPCHVNVNCTTGADWQMQKLGVVRILRFFEQGVGWCSGSLVNNTSNDGSPYVLSAYHCIAGLTPDYDLWRFDFNYEAGDCTNPASEPAFQSIVGCNFRSGREQSDFLLLELSTDIPASYPIYLNGWSRDSLALPGSSAGIHHPQGDVKKISIDNDPASVYPSPIIWNNNVTTPAYHHLLVQLDQGTIENGSSGSPLFNQDGVIVGQLHGGNASCSTFVTYYGRMAKSWDAGPTPDTRLKEWLDPINSGAVMLDGFGPPTPSMVSVSGTIKTFRGAGVGNVKVYLTGDMTTSVISDESGHFIFSNVPANGSYAIIPEKDINPRNGITSIDVILIAKDLFGIDPLANPFQRIAGDVTNNQVLSSFDIIEIRKLLLFFINNFSNTKSWQFVPATIPVTNLSGNISAQNFIGIKMGDVNGSANPQN